MCVSLCVCVCVCKRVIEKFEEREIGIKIEKERESDGERTCIRKERDNVIEKEVFCVFEIERM